MKKMKKILSFAVVPGVAFIWTLSAASVAFAGDFHCKSIETYPINGGSSVEVFLIDKNSPPQCEAARDSMLAAAVIVTGGESKGRIYTWAKQLAADPNYTEKFNDNLKFGDAVKWLKARIATNAADRLFMLENAFHEVYGKDSTPLEQSQYDSQIKAQKTWYAPIVLAEAAKMNNNPDIHTTVLNLSFKLAFGRPPSEQELNYWKTRKEHFRLLIDDHRRRLYSSEGAQERIDVLTRYYAFTKNGATPSDAWLKMALASVADKKPLYFELIASPKEEVQLAH